MKFELISNVINSLNSIQIKGNNEINKSKFNEGIDWITILITFTLVFIGLLSIYSSSPELLRVSLVQKQIISLSVGIFVMLLLIYSPVGFLKIIPVPIYILSILTLGFTLIFGEVIKGTKGWIRFGGFSFQPAELAKFAVLLNLAKYLSRKGVDIRIVRNFSFSIFIVILPVALIMMQPDIGSATVILFMLLGIFYWTGFELLVIYAVIVTPFVVLLSLVNTTYLIVSTSLSSLVAILFRSKIYITIVTIIVFIVLGLGSPIIYENLMPHQKNRIQSFLNPGSDPRGSGYNVWQSMMAVGSGGLTGKGYLKGTLTQLKYIPEQWTDFIFSVTAEEFGFIGGSIVIILQLLLIVRIFNIAYSIEDKFFSILAFGTGTIFFYHCLINIGMVIGLSPVMGIPLPFMSYGGSSIIINLSMVGLCISAKRHFVIKRKMS